MVVLSASICSRSGKALVSRQFVEMNRLRVEGLLAAFPKLVGHAKQHTFVETDQVRYVYQPLENQLYLLLITTKASNIVEDLGTLRLLAKVVPDVAGSMFEHDINEHAFDLIFAFDEVLTAGGYKEEATLSSIRTNLIMDSHEERIHDELQRSKQEAASAEMRRQAKVIKDRQMAHLKQNLMTGHSTPAPTGGMQGFGGGGPAQSGSIFDQFNPEHQQGIHSQFQKFQAPEPAKVEAPKVLAKGMKLGGGSAVKKDNLMAAMAAEDNLFPLSGATSSFGAVATGPAAAPSTPLTLALEERITVVLNREGGIDSSEVKGTLSLTANTDAGVAALVSVNKSVLSGLSNWSFQTHPKVDKKAYEQQGLLSLKGDKGLPLNRPVGILRWSYGGEDAAPITINCWPEDEGTGSINVNVEFELTRTDLVLHDVNILLPLGTTDPPVMESIDGQYKHDPRAGMMCWHFDVVDGNNSTGTMEFSIAGHNTDAFFPIQVGFKSDRLLCPIEVTGVVSSANGSPIPNDLTKSFAPDSYQCP